MAQAALYANYSMLKSTILKMWVPAAGVETAADFWTKNLEKFNHFIRNLNELPPVLTLFLNIIKETCIEFFKHHAFKTNFESYFDIQPPFQLSKAILTGSLSEGLFVYTTEPPDFDFLCVLNNIKFSQEDQESNSLLLREDTPFAYAFITNKETQNAWSEFLDDGDKQYGKYRLSSGKLKQKLLENYQKTGNMFFHNFRREQFKEISERAAVTIFKLKPAVSLSFVSLMAEMLKKVMTQTITASNIEKVHSQMVYHIFYKIVPSCDIVLAIFCDGWPSCAQEWATRERFWPDIHSARKITQCGFHIVPKSSSDGDFRLSFSCAETKLIQTLLPLQHKVMRAFKAVVKYYQNTWNPNIQGIISSYHLKTISFWHFEKTSQEFWAEDTLVHHIVFLLEKLAEALRSRSLPMYFMPKVNLFQDIDDPEVAFDLMDKILQLCHDLPAISGAVRNSVVTNVFAEVGDPTILDDVHETIRAGKVKKFEDRGESPYTFYDFFECI